MEEALIRRLMTSVECGVCKQRYEGDNISVLSHYANLWFLSASCLACHTRSLVVAVVRQGKEPEVITELTPAKLDKFRNRDEITADDILDMHLFLRDFDGDFSRLFNPKENEYSKQ